PGGQQLSVHRFFRGQRFVWFSSGRYKAEHLGPAHARRDSADLGIHEVFLHRVPAARGRRRAGRGALRRSLREARDLDRPARKRRRRGPRRSHRGGRPDRQPERPLDARLWLHRHHRRGARTPASRGNRRRVAPHGAALHRRRDRAGRVAAAQGNRLRGTRAFPRAMDRFDPLIASGIAAAIPLVFAALGELVAERAGVLNLGVEGMMLVGALAAFATVAVGGGVTLALGAAMLAGIAAAAAFAVLTLTLQANQVAAGLALTILGTGVSAFLGRGYVGFRAPATFEDLPVPALSGLPVIGGTGERG